MTSTMNNMWNRIVSLLICMMTNMISYAYDFEVDGIYYNVLSMEEKTVEVTHSDDGPYTVSYPCGYNFGIYYYNKYYYYNSYYGEVVVPAIVSYMGKDFTVKQIGNAAFLKQAVTKISLPSTIEVICNNYAYESKGSGHAGAFDGSDILSAVVGNAICLNSLDYTQLYKTSTVITKLKEISFAVDYQGDATVDFSKAITLEKIFLYSQNPPIFSSNSFSNSQQMNIPVYVPEEYLETYQQADVWKDFWNLIPMKMQSNILLNASQLELAPNADYQLIADVQPEDAFNKDIIWSCSNSAVAIVDENGKVTTIAKGNAVITATAADGSGVSASCNVHVVDLANSISYKFVDGILTINCDEPNATVYYTIDGTTPTVNSTKYEGPIEIKRNCTVKALATYKDFTPSEIVLYVIDGLKVKTPTINFIDSKFVIETEPADATIYYTTDGTIPNRQSAQYTEPIFIDYNCTIKAFAVCEDLNDSEIASYNFEADAVRLSAPQIVREGNTLVVTSIADGANVHYTIDGSVPTLQSPVYTAPIEISHNMVMNAIAMKENSLNSKMVTFVVDEFTCEPVKSMSYNGRYLTLATTMPNSEILYTIDGTAPTSSSTKYTNAIDVEGLSTIRAIVTSQYFNNSEEVTFETKYYCDRENVAVKEVGIISKAFEWCGTDNIKKLVVNGDIDNSDLSFVMDIPSLRHLDLENANIIGNTILDGAFANKQIISVFLPKTLTSVGSNLFAGCGNIAAIGWSANKELPSSTIAGISNPNLLLYVLKSDYAPSNIKNVIVNGVAENIALNSGNGDSNCYFYCPREFTASKISYTHNYTQKTVSGKCTGWETIALPFTPTSITHSKNGQMAPFAANDVTKKPFWLCELTESGFVNSDAIKANTPYIIAMPNNEHYADEYILSGDVTFEGSNVKVLASSELNYGSKGDKTFVPSFMNADKDECMTLNVGETYEGHAMGSMFVQGLRNASPFEAYVTMHGLQSMTRQIFCIDDMETDIERNENDDININIAGQNVTITGITNGDYICIYNVAGNMISSSRSMDKIMYINNLHSGIYILTVKRNGSIVKSTKFNL